MAGIKVVQDILPHSIQCDAQRLCTSRSSRRTACEYETQSEETHTQAVKWKYDDITRVCEMYEELFGLLGSGDEQAAADIVRCIRSGQNRRAAVSYIRAGRRLMDHYEILRLSPVSDEPRTPLAHSIASLKDVVRLAMSGTSPAHRNAVLESRILETLPNRIIHLKHLEAMLQRPPIVQDSPFRWREGGVSSTVRLQHEPIRLIGSPLASGTTAGKGMASTRRESRLEDGLEDVGQLVLFEPERPPDYGPTHMVTANPWPTTTSDDEAVSHLVSLFLTWTNPSWRFVEEDPFFRSLLGSHL